MSSSPSQYPIALGIVSGSEQPFPVPMNNITMTHDVSDAMLEKPQVVPFKPIQPVSVLKSANYSLK